MTPKYSVGDTVSLQGRDFSFEGVVIGAFTKLSGVWRYAVENDRGDVKICTERDLMPHVPDATEVKPVPMFWGAPAATGEVCVQCGGAHVIRTGSCSTCQDCGTTTSCG